MKRIGVAMIVLLLVALTAVVVASGQPLELTADTLEYDDTQGLVTATGNVVLRQGDTVVTGAQAIYSRNDNTAVVSGGAELQSQDMVMTASELHAYLNDKKAVGNGGVHIVSAQRELDAVADQATYYEQERKVLLTGHAKAIQQGNTLTGDSLTVYIDKKTMDATGRPKLIIIPKENSNP